MGSRDWNVLELSLYVYAKYIKPFLLQWGFFDNCHLMFETTSRYIQSLCPEFFLKTIGITGLITSFKFLLLIALLVFIRGGVPRYRYDFLTKIG